MLICFIGIDGCGKTTLTNSIYEKFYDHNFSEKRIPHAASEIRPITVLVVSQQKRATANFL